MKSYIFAICVICVISIPPNGDAAFGGHDLFTSLAQLQVLWGNDQVKNIIIFYSSLTK